MTYANEARSFWNREATRYSRKPIADEAAYRHKLSLTESYLRPDMDVFEFGCGTGSTAIVHAPHVRSILATDLSEEMIEIARRKAEAAAVSNIRFEAISIEALSAAPGKFDAALGLSVLHLVEDLPATLRRVHSLLKPGGFFFSNTVCVRDMGATPVALIRLLRATRLGPPVNALGSQYLMAQMVAAGFDVRKTWQPAPKKALFIVAQKPGSA